MLNSLSRLFRRCAPSRRPARRPRPAGCRPSLESLGDRILLSRGLTPTAPLLGGATLGPAEVRAAAGAPAALAGPGATQSLSVAASSASTGAYSQILSPIIPMTLSDGRTSGATIWALNAAGNLTLHDPVAVAYRAWPKLTYCFSLADGTGVATLNYQADFVRSDGYTFHSASGSLKYSPGSSISLPLPPQVGQYTLKVRLYASGILDQTRQNTVYVLLNTPLDSAAAARSPFRGPVIRSELAIRYAAQWATGQSTAAGVDAAARVVAALNRSIYSNPLGWKYGNADYDPPLRLPDGGRPRGRLLQLRGSARIHGGPAGDRRGDGLL